jgi:hypothetical protein
VLASFTTSRDKALQLPTFEYGPLTSGGDYGVDGIVAVDEDVLVDGEGRSPGYVYFTSNKHSAITKGLFRAPLVYQSSNTSTSNSSTSLDPVECLSDFIGGNSGGYHEILALDIRAKVYIDVYSDAKTPPVTYLRSFDTSHPFYKDPVVLQDPRVNNARFERMYKYFTAPVFDTFDGCEIIVDKEVFQDKDTSTTTPATTPTSVSATSEQSPSPPSDSHIEAVDRLIPSSRLHCSVYLPDAQTHGPGPYPGIVSLYGGPHVQMVADKWTVSVIFVDMFV